MSGFFCLGGSPGWQCQWLLFTVQICEVSTEGKFGFVAGGETQHRAQDGTSSSQE